MNNKLKSISTDILLNELLSRYHHCIFAGIVSYRDEDVTQRKIHGDPVTCLGLCALVQQLAHTSWSIKQQAPRSKRRL